MILIPRNAKVKAAEQYYSGASDPLAIATQMLKAALPDLEEAMRQDIEVSNGKAGQWENLTPSLCADLNRLGEWVLEETDDPTREYIQSTSATSSATTRPVGTAASRG